MRGAGLSEVGQYEVKALVRSHLANDPSASSGPSGCWVNRRCYFQTLSCPLV